MARIYIADWDTYISEVQIYWTRGHDLTLILVYL